MYSIKVSHNGEVRRLTIPLDGIVATAYEQLIQTVRNLFSDLQLNRSFCLTWQDDEGDTVTVSSDLELTEAIRVMAVMYGGNSLRFTVKKLEKPVSGPETSTAAPASGAFVRGGDRLAAAMKKEEEETIHYGVQCDECGVSPIVGTRYKCTVRHNYDLCSSCYNKKTQPYPMNELKEAVGHCRRGRGKGKCFDMPPHGPPHHHMPGHHGHHPHGPHRGGNHGRGGGRGMFHWFGGAPGEGIPYEGCEDYYGPFSDPAAAEGGCKKEKEGACGAPAPGPHHPPHRPPFGGPPHGGPHHPPVPPHGGIFGGRGGHGGRGCPFGGRGGPGGRGSFGFGGPLVVEAEIYAEPAKEGTTCAPPAAASATAGATTQQSEGSVVHTGVTCDVCGKSPITGPRYKCTVRNNYDVCAACYESQLQPYPMLKIVTNGGVGTVVTPAAPVVRDLNDEDAGLQAAISESYATSAAATSVPAGDVPPPLLRSTISETSATVDDEEGVEDVYAEHSFTFVEKDASPVPAPAASSVTPAAAAAPEPAAATTQWDTERLFAEAAATAERLHQEQVWAKELKLLSDMGFTETSDLIPLLQQHIATPASSAGSSPAAAVEGMQQVVAALLLGQSTRR